MSTSPQSETLTLDEIKPYWRNPRRITDDAVEAVQGSLGEFGYVQPIVVDEDNVIVIGHTRYTAMRRLGVTEAEVLKATDLSPQRIKQLRVIDNRTHEFSLWDADKLWSELEAIGEDPLVQDIFPEARAPEDDDDGARNLADFESGGPIETSPLVEFVCPSCFHEWEQPVSREQVLSGTLKMEETQ